MSEIDNTQFLRKFIAHVSVRYSDKQRSLADSLIAAVNDDNPDSSRFIEHVDRRRKESRLLWQRGLTQEWWSRASPDEMMTTYLAAFEMALVDDEAAEAVRIFKVYSEGGSEYRTER